MGEGPPRRFHRAETVSIFFFKPKAAEQSAAFLLGGVRLPGAL
jgi:hypothetical protein